MLADRLIGSAIRFCLGCALALAGVPEPPAWGAEASAREDDCYWQLIQGRSEEIACTFPTVMSGEDRKELRRLTRDLVRDARCEVHVRIARRLIDEAGSAGDHVFEAPPQPVACEVETSENVYPMAFAFAPRVVFENGRAVEASPGMSPVEGIPGVLSWPVRPWVNRSRSIEDGMLQVINAYLKRRPPPR